ncbi:MAG: RNA methyltransferase [Lachnospiraceae bacterium]|nr:RNA methyltransferase [Lachnospiraceae bacterium]
MITSIANEKIKHVAALQQKAKLRREESLFVVEGGRLFLEAPVSLIIEVYITKSFFENADGRMREKLAQTGYEEVSEQVFGKMSDTKAPQGILAVLAQQKYKKEELMGTSPLLLLLENIQDPGNLGTILRTAEGAGVTGVILSPDCADIYQPKVVRSTMGSLFRVPFYRTEGLHKDIEFLQNRSVKVYAAYLEGSDCYDTVSYLGGCAFLIGNEGNGLTRETAMAADACIRIPMEGKLESLNAGVSAALLVYEAARQRRNSRA